MNIDAVRTFCLSLPGVTEDIKWDDDLVFSVGGKMFVVAMLEPPHRVSFKCDDETFAELVERDGVIPAPYLARAMWVSIESLGTGMDWRELEDRVRRSYDLVKAGLPKRVQAELGRSPSRGRPGTSVRPPRSRG
jgi:predicted DNA-binding protein (MmcQ/YjbR family)